MLDFKTDVDAVQQIDAVPKILEVVCRTTGMGFAAVARVTEDRWICCASRDDVDFGLPPGGELKVETTLCHEIRQSQQAIIIDNVAEDGIYCNHHTPALYGLQSYISIPILLADGSMFGTLCAIDSKPHKLNTPEIIGMFQLFADLIAFHLNAIDKVNLSEAQLSNERATSVLREQFIAVLGHDLRNPLASIAAGNRMLRKSDLSEDDLEVLGLMQSSIDRMSSLIDNVLDFARGRLGGGITLVREDCDLTMILNQAVDELQSSHPDREISIDCGLSSEVNCDPVRIGQLFSNLLGNALSYGDPTKPVTVECSSLNNVLELSVSNEGSPIPPAAMAQLFLPFSRGAARRNEQGLGLRLYIASQIAEAHGGRIDVASDENRTKFTLRMPAMSR